MRNEGVPALDASGKGETGIYIDLCRRAWDLRRVSGSRSPDTIRGNEPTLEELWLRLLADPLALMRGGLFSAALSGNERRIETGSGTLRFIEDASVPSGTAFIASVVAERDGWNE